MKTILTRVLLWLSSWRSKPPVKSILCKICQSDEDVEYSPFMTGLHNYTTPVCLKCYLIWYSYGLTTNKEILKKRNEQSI